MENEIILLSGLNERPNYTQSQGHCSTWIKYCDATDESYARFIIHGARKTGQGGPVNTDTCK